MGNLKISGNTTQIQDWDISNILDDYMDMCKEIHDKENMGSETSRVNMTYWEIDRLKDFELAMEYDRKLI